MQVSPAPRVVAGVEIEPRAFPEAARWDLVRTVEEHVGELDRSGTERLRRWQKDF